ncbi:hypothetical protein M8C13_36125 [Crossiella sp. SN42]|uniref:WXG100-like domain-containing protein n=1 Tax=Crossiella sp. SN42 TaxID=2944808 RepID=UPI00207C2610|nr:hypothetical protein [Crossiella sp. SN42]MCO1581192.1 hypothetical protein [Crossiella sp. SN42]
MTIAEPADPLGLWARVSPAIGGWPDSDETRAGRLAEGWRQAAANLNRLRGTDLSDLPRGWADQGGTAFTVRTGELDGRAEGVARRMSGLAARSAQFAEEVTGVKNMIHDGVASHSVPYAATFLLPPRWAEPYQEFIAASLARDLSAGMLAAEQRLSQGPEEEGNWFEELLEDVVDNGNDIGAAIGELAAEIGDEIRDALSPHTEPEHEPSPDREPSGNPTVSRPGDDEETKRGHLRENEGARTLAKAGYDIMQNPPAKPNGKNPDYFIQGEYWDAYAPGPTKTPRGVASVISDKIEDEQAYRHVINLADSTVNLDELRGQFQNYPIDKLEEIIVIDRDGTVIPFYP